MTTHHNNPPTLLLKGSLTPIYASSIVIAVLMTAASVAGIFFQTATYPTVELLENFFPNDVLMLAIGLPMLLVSMALTCRKRLIGLLLWQGALVFVFYNYFIYVLAMPLNLAYLLHLAMVLLSFYALIALIAGIDASELGSRLAGAVLDRLSGAILAVLGFLFLLRALGMLIGGLSDPEPMAGTELALNSSDFLITPTWVLGGILLWRRKALGYVIGLGLLFQASMLFIGLIVFMLVQPILTEAPFPLVDIVVVFVMGLICFVPFGLYLRGVLTTRKL
ncbi:MAG: hypothetical protein PVI78_03495 [Anaerolineales bacterium]|jgi:hypothetical protein